MHGLALFVALVAGLLLLAAGLISGSERVTTAGFLVFLGSLILLFAAPFLTMTVAWWL